LISINVMVVLDLVAIVKKRELTFSLNEGTTIKQFIETMISIYGPKLEKAIYADKDKGELNLNIYLNGQHIHFINGLDSLLQDGDTLLFMPHAGGG